MHQSSRSSDSAAAERRRSSLVSASASLFGEDSAPLFAAFDRAAERLVVRSGDIVCKQGDPGDALYIITHGSLEVLSEDGNTWRSLAVVGRGGSVGEMALLVGEPRSATVRAIRDSELLRVDKGAFDALLADQPAVAVELARSLVRRLKHSSSARPAPRRPRTVALVPVGDDDRGTVADLARGLADALAREFGKRDVATIVASDTADRTLRGRASQLSPGDDGEPRVVEWLAQLEDAHPFVLFLAEGPDSPWTRRTIRQADLILPIATAALGAGGGESSGRALVNRALSSAPNALGRRELVLLHEAGVSQPRDTARWLGAKDVMAHHHVRPSVPDDVRRLARRIAARSNSVVLSGGGARGFAHIGVLRAVREAGIPIDVIGGTSMGAVIAALHASGHDIDAMIDVCRRNYATNRGRGDRTIPVTAFTSGRQSVRTMKAMFGDRAIEDLWTRFFAMTTSLTQAHPTPRDRGPLWLWTRVSCAIPGLAPPFAFEGEIFADGGILDNLPVAAMRERCAGRVIASDVSLPVDLEPQSQAASDPVVSGWEQLWKRVNPFASSPPSMPSIMEILQRTALVGGVRDADAAGHLADLFLRLPVQAYGMTSFGDIDPLVDVGYRYAVERIEDWQIQLRTGAGPSDVVPPS